MTEEINDLKNQLQTRIDKLSFLPKQQQDSLSEMNKKCELEKEFKAVRMLVGIIEKTAAIVNAKTASEILKGAHVVIKDCADLYHHAKEKLDTRGRITSHYWGKKKTENGKQLNDLGVNIPSNADVAAGVNKDNHIWFQMEWHKVDFSKGIIKGIYLFIRHMIDYLQYRITGKNIGPNGSSDYTETNPLVLPKQVIQDLLSSIGEGDLLRLFDEKKIDEKKHPGEHSERIANQASFANQTNDGFLRE